MAIVCDICGKGATAKRGFFALAVASRYSGTISFLLVPIESDGLRLSNCSYSCICTDCLKKLNIEKAIRDNEEFIERISGWSKKIHHSCRKFEK